MAWEPQEEPLKQLAKYLQDSLNHADKNVMRNAEIQMLNQAKASPDINNYLAYLFANSGAATVSSIVPEYVDLVRAAAAMMLKNGVRTSYKAIPQSSKDYIKSMVLLGIQDPKSNMRNYAGNVVTEIIRQGGVMGWPELLQELILLASNESGNSTQQTQEGAMGALLKLCEDNTKALDKDYSGTRPINHLFPKFLQLTTSPLPKVRANALASMNVFIADQPPAVMSNIDALLSQLSQLAADPNTEVRKHVCRAFIHIADISPERIAPHLDDLVKFMVSQQRTVEDPELALDAAEFWLCLGEDENLRDYLGPYLPQIVPVLLDSMVYDKDEVERLEAEAEDDADEDDNQEDIKPQFASTKDARLTAATNGETDTSTNGSGKSTAANFDENELSDGEIEDYDDSDIGDPEEQWNLRKCSAAALDVLASVFHQPVFEETQQYLKNNLNHPEWPYREAAVLALGAIAEGCMDVVTPHLPDLTNYLTSLLNDKQPVVRKITCWSLGRYSGWASQLDMNGQQQYFVPVMDGILRRMLDSNKSVQEAAASAFANLEEKAGRSLENYCPVIVRQFVECFARYKDRNMFILYDCVQTLAEHVGPALARPELIQILMPALIDRWNKVSDQSREMFPLLECLSYVATALKSEFAPFAKPIFTRCITIIQQNLEADWLAKQDPGIESPDKDFLVTSLDLLSAIIQSLDSTNITDLVATSQPNLFRLIAYCMDDGNNDVRQSAYALLGDCAIYVFDQLQEYLPSILEILIAQLELSQVLNDAKQTNYSVVNNACWSAGEIAMRRGAGMAPYVERLLQRLAAILFNNKVPISLNENAAIAVGRLGIGCPDALAPHLSQFGPSFVKIISHVDWTDEKSHALSGFINVVLANPAAMEHCLLDFFVELASAPKHHVESGSSDTSADWRIAFQKAIDVYKGMINNFDGFLQQLPTEKEQLLRQTYRV
ncbi:ARM repeat-containing protein [Pseudovirgaria hyperparasitica]|uniref:ARM repeat-containing protein n=1 Tax=Pseudovirgaria hyperparasitica TaxID=470096 RepID=A0A6A6W5C5_9PEZI|nr:ARM repeat-containing protein [Pseudovirgaria hyperparasitica]KAF2757156.1 ARM repeat-containing protein [Pseudovirgaria hyperparasitica]